MRTLILFLAGAIGMLPFCASADNYSISIDVSEQTMGNPIVQNAVTDVMELLETACKCKVSRNNAADHVLKIPDLDPARALEPSRFARQTQVDFFHYPAHYFSWSAENHVLVLEAPTAQGVANGLYALLQDQLGFRFYHPREMIVPDLTTWPLAADFTFAGKPAFDKKGFHLHTQHPLELTDVIHNHKMGEAGLQMIYTYIDWLARNGQNFFEFCLLEDISIPKWPEYARKFTDYAHDRGILCSVDLSLHMVQQKAFKLFRFPPKSLRPFKKQIDIRLDALMRANWDFINMEFSVAEFVGGMEKMRARLREHIVHKLATDFPEVKLLGRQHVVKAEDEIGGSGSHNPLADTSEPARGLLVHTVMGYGVDWEKAPVYESENQRHMLDVLNAQQSIRECWFYPESAYWITFDNSIPLLFLPYLQARWDDIQLMKKMQVPGHITFSSGWEWGYWLVDWSIARWSWDYEKNGVSISDSPVSPFASLSKDPEVGALFQEMLDLEMQELVEQEGMKYLTASTLTDELPEAINKQFMPRPDFTYKWLFEEATPAQLDSTEAALDRRLNIRKTYSPLLSRASSLLSDPETLKPIREIFTAVGITEQRAWHRHHIFAHLIQSNRINRKIPSSTTTDHLSEAQNHREKALTIVREIESGYRYPVEYLAGRHNSYTAYNFGYLWPAHDLHFWVREEKQAQKGKWSPLYMNIWDAFKIAGFKD